MGWRNELSDVRGPAVQARSIHGDIYFGNSPGRLPVPGQLLPGPANFTGRVRELAAMERLVADAEVPRPVTLAVIVGSGGAGKTSLASFWLHHVRGRYRGGQLFADLGGFSAAGPAEPAEVLAGFVRALGIAPDRVPAGLAELAALYRSLTDGRRMAVMLDDAASAAQVRVLLPGPGPSLVVVTSRQRLAGLAMDGAQFVEVGPLDEPDAVELFGRIVGGARAGSEPGASREVVRLCARLPLAVCVAGALLAPNPQWPIGAMAAELEDERGRLAALSVAGDISVRAAFDVSYQVLPPAAGRLYRLLALVPGPGFGPDLAAAAAAIEVAEAKGLLVVLTGASLLEQTGGRRFRFHDLVRLHAREQAATEPAAGRRAVVAQAVDWYLHAAVAADVVVIPDRWRLGPLYTEAGRAPPAYPGPADALAWLESELAGLVASVWAAYGEGMHERAWQLCEALWGLFAHRKHYTQWISSHELGVASATACGDRRAQARMRVQLGLAYRQLGRHQEARAQFSRALALDRAEGHRVGEATALEQLGLADLTMGQTSHAIAAFAGARDIFTELGVARGVAMMTCHIGEANRDAGRYQEAIGDLTEARRLSAAIPDPYNEARALTSLGQTCLRAGRPADAAAPLHAALDIMEQIGSRYEQARIHTALAHLAGQVGDTARARGHLEAALAVYDELGVPEATGVRRHLEALGPGPTGPADSENDTDPTAS